MTSCTNASLEPIYISCSFPAPKLNPYPPTKRIRATVMKRKECPNMSFCCCFYSPNGYVLASDSRSSIIADDRQSIKYWEDNFKKIIYLPKSKYAFIAAGQNRINGMDITSFLQQLDDKLSYKNPKDALQYIKDEIQPLVYSNVNLCLATIHESKPCSYYINILNKQTEQKMLQTHKICDKDTEPKENLSIWHHSPDNSMFQKLYCEGTTLCINPDVMTLSTMIDFAKHLVETHINIYRFRVDYPSVIGGPIQILAVDRTGNIVASENI